MFASILTGIVVSGIGHWARATGWNWWPLFAVYTLIVASFMAGREVRHRQDEPSACKGDSHEFRPALGTVKRRSRAFGWAAFMTLWSAGAWVPVGVWPKALVGHMLAAYLLWSVKFHLQGWAHGFETLLDAVRKDRAEAKAGRLVVADPSVLWNAPDEAPDDHGFLYAVQFSSNVVKVGQTANPRRRLAEHCRDAWAFKVTPTDYWISPPHAAYVANEVRLLIALSEKADSRSKREYFHGVEMATVIRLAKEIIELHEGPHGVGSQPASPGILLSANATPAAISSTRTRFT